MKSTTKKLPPISEISVVILALVVAGILVIANLFYLSRLVGFAWKTFFKVAKWTLLAYALFAGALEYIFIKDGTRGSVLALMSATIVIFAINLPIHFGFTVSRYADPE
jgi:hypothetical protein